MAKSKQLEVKKYDGTRPESYLPKLKAIMKRLGVQDSDWMWNADRFSVWIDFKIDGKSKRFSHSIENAALHGYKLERISDVFAQLVMTLGDLERAFRYGTYTFDMFMRSLPMLEAPKEAGALPWWASVLGMSKMPANADEVVARWREAAKACHPDKGGSEDLMANLNRAKDAGKQFFGEAS